jgi:hypothetical protein
MRTPLEPSRFYRSAKGGKRLPALPLTLLGSIYHGQGKDTFCCRRAGPSMRHSQIREQGSLRSNLDRLGRRLRLCDITSYRQENESVVLS